MIENKKVITAFEAEAVALEMHSSGEIIGMCHGVFDLLHPGHFAHFKAAKAKVGALFVSVTADKFVNKGPNRPLFPDVVRAETISMLECVDYVLISENETAVESINTIRPHFYFKGSDYAHTSDDVTGMISIEIEEIRKHGGEIHYTNELTSSSSTLINTYFSTESEDFNKWLKEFHSKHSLDSVFHYLDLIEQTQVGVIGEIIIDRYTNCEPLAKSSKDPILAFQIQNTETFMGGVLAIRDNIKSWTGKASLFSSLPSKIQTENMLLVEEIEKLSNFHWVKNNNKLIVKHRYVDINSKSRIFETYDFCQEVINSSSTSFFDLLSQHDESMNLWVIADYGHGLISRELAGKISDLKTFLAVNTQANAGNRGFNTITKFPRADFLCLNGGELQLELRDRNLDYEIVVPEYMKQLKSSYAVLTLGARGMMIFSKDAHTLVPALGN